MNTPVMSLQTGAELGRTAREIIDPRNLSIDDDELEGPLIDQTPTQLRLDDVRHIDPPRLLIESADELVGVSAVRELQKIYEYTFLQKGNHVVGHDEGNVDKVIA